MERLIPLSFTTLTLTERFIGSDILVSLFGGDAHIGSVVLAIPRPSLTGSGKVSCTSSVLNVTGHKDEEVLRTLAETYCKTYQARCVCTGGIHIDGITPSQIREIVDWAKDYIPQSD